MSSNPIFIFFGGFLMGFADLFPGVSGGTVAFLLGLYPILTAGLRGAGRQALFRFAILLLGMGSALLLFAPLLSGWLADPGVRALLFALFLGCLFGSLPSCAREVTRWERSSWIALLTGGVLAATLSLSLTVSPEGEPAGWWLFMSGALAICATLLPGISGGAILLILGVYPTAIGALAALRYGDLTALVPLAWMGSGIALGALLFGRVIDWLLTHARNQTFPFLLGSMVGATPPLWRELAGAGILGLALFALSLATLLWLSARGHSLQSKLPPRSEV